MTEIAKIIRTERTKLTASSLNTIGLAFAITGGVVPMIGLVIPDFVTPSPIRLVISLWWVVLGFVLHIAARAILGRLEE